MDHNTPVRVVNSSSKPWADGYANTVYNLSPGQEAIVPFSAICLWFGHPEAVDIDERRKYRTDEFTRLSTRYGVYEGYAEDESGHPVAPDRGVVITLEELWDRNKPSVEVYTLTGERIITVVDDPSGARITPATSTMAERELLLDQMSQMKQQLAAMQMRLDQQARAEVSVTNSGIIPEDESPTPDHSVDQTAVPNSEVSEDLPFRVRVGE